MLIPITRLLQAPVMSLQTGSKLATITGVIVDPRKLKIAAFNVEGPRLSHNASVLHPEDIREVSTIGCIIDDESVLMPTDDLVRLNEVIGFRFQLDGIRVENEKGALLGKVSGYAIDQESFFVQQLYTKPSLMRSIMTTGLTIHRNQIVSINNRRIVVKEASLSADQPIKSPLPQGFVNPFRNPLPSPPDN